MPTTQTCDSCIYFLLLESTSGRGRCRRYPPKDVGTGESPTKDDVRGRRWPVCWVNEWCGEWSTK